MFSVLIWFYALGGVEHPYLHTKQVVTINNILEAIMEYKLSTFAGLAGILVAVSLFVKVLVTSGV